MKTVLLSIFATATLFLGSAVFLQATNRMAINMQGIQMVASDARVEFSARR